MQDTFVTIARFPYSTEAQIVKGRLEADGIKVFLSDNITIDTDPLVSQAIGGVKLKVLAKDEEKARAIFQSIKSYALDDNGKAIQCPNCNQEHIELYTTITGLKSLLSFIIGFVSGTLPFSTRYQYKCEDCNTEFPLKS
jgi:DNA-directed RNA polymerase subunit RPC12/RpoP